MIYQPKPQRGGRSIITNTNNPPQDPPPPPIEIISPIEVEPAEIIPPIKVVRPKVTKKVTPKSTVKIPKKKPEILTATAKIVKLTFGEKIFRFLKKIFRRV